MSPQLVVQPQVLAVVDEDFAVEDSKMFTIILMHT